MQNARFKSAHTAHTAKHGIRPSRFTLFRMFLTAVGFTGAVVFGFLSNTALLSNKEAYDALSVNGFNGASYSFIVPGFLLSVCLFSYGVYELYKIYRQLNDPNNYGKKSRRTTS